MISVSFLRPFLRNIWLLSLLASLIPLPASATELPFFLPYPKIDTNRWFIASGWTNGPIQSCEWRSEAVSSRDNNLVLTLSDKGEKISPISCGELQSTRKYGYGTFSARLRAAKGSGLNTGFFSYTGPPQGSPVHDEIDFEFLGKNSRTVQLNYYINAKAQGAVIIDLGFDASEAFHDYTYVWEPNKIRWYIDKKLVHETADGVPIPSHPGKIHLTLWSGSEQINDWLGPFKYEGDVDAEFSWVKYTPLH